MQHSQGPPNRTHPQPSIAPASSTHQAPPSYPPRRPLPPLPGSLDPMKKRLLRAWDVNEDLSKPLPTAVASRSKRRRYPKLLTTDKDGKLIANPLRIPPNTPPPLPLTIPLPSSLSASPANHKPAPTPAKPRTSFARSITRPRRRLPYDRAMCVSGAAPLVVRPVFTDRNGETFSMVFRPSNPVKLPPNPMDEVCERPCVSDGMVQVEQGRRDGGEKSFVRVQEAIGGGRSFAASQEGGEQKDPARERKGGGGENGFNRGQGAGAVEKGFAAGQAGLEETQNVAKRQEDGRREDTFAKIQEGGRGEMVFARAPGSIARTGRVFNPTAIPQRPVKENKSVNGGGEDTAVAGDGRVIQVGRRSGTVHYWRSSLQMPKRNDKVLSAMQRAGVGRGEEVKGEANGGNMKARGNERLERGRGREGAERVGRSATALDVGMEDEVRSAAPILPNSGAEKTKQGKVGSSGRQDVPLGTGHSIELSAGVQGSCSADSRGQGLVAGESRSEQVGGSRKSGNVGNGLRDLKGIEAQKALEEERNEIRRLHLTKNYEIRKLEAYAESRYHVKMNLRGRHKLENWLSSEDPVASNSVLFIVLVLNLDRRLVSKEARERREALGDMNNEHLRMLEALMARTSTRDGYTNWGVLTANFRGDRTA